LRGVLPTVEKWGRFPAIAPASRRIKITPSLKALGLLLVLSLCACATPAVNPGNEQPVASAAPATPAVPGTPSPYFIEFHARESDVGIGHTFLVYGERNAAGNPITRSVVGFYPAGGYVGMVFTPVAIPGVVGKNPDDEKMKDLVIFRYNNMTAGDYARLMQYVANAESGLHLFNVFTNNCNDFAGGAAKTIRLRIPSNAFTYPKDFVAELWRLNDPSAPPELAGDSSTNRPPGSAK
jgi:hypothetical protein